MFALVNLMEAHEPYLVPDSLEGDSRRLEYARQRQDLHAWIRGSWEPDETERARLRWLYERAVESVDHRLARLVRLFEARTDPDRPSVVVITSDHGQAFGEDGIFYHGIGLSDEITRIPLWVRWPDRENAGREVSHWASLLDVPRTLLAAAGSQGPATGPGMDLRYLQYEDRVGPIYAESEGLRWDPRRDGRITPANRRRFERRWLVSFEGNVKVALDTVSREARVYDLGGASDVRRDALGPPAEVERLATEFHRWIENGVGARTGTEEAEVSDSLRAWGYI